MSEFRTIGSFAKQLKRVNESNSSGADVYSVTKYDGFVRSLDYFKKQVFSRDLSSYKIVKKGEFAYSTIHLDEGALGLLGDEEALISPMYTTFEVDASVERQYLAYLLKSPNLINQYGLIGQGSVNRRKSVPFSSLAELEVFIPPLPEQKKIAEILSGIDRVIYSTSTARDRLFLLKKSLCLKLLATESKQCRQSKFSDVCIKIQDGTHFSPQSKDGNCLYITSKNIRPGRLDLSSINWISTEEHNTIYKRCQVQKGDILLTKDGANTGNACLNTLEEEFSLLSSVAFLRPNPSYCDANYMLQWIMSVAFQNEIQQEMSGNAISRLTLTKINNLSISLPPLEKQKEIAETLLSIDNQCKSYESKIDSFQMLKQAISADLLSGRKRVSI